MLLSARLTHSEFSSIAGHIHTSWGQVSNLWEPMILHCLSLKPHCCWLPQEDESGCNADNTFCPISNTESHQLGPLLEIPLSDRFSPWKGCAERHRGVEGFLCLIVTKYFATQNKNCWWETLLFRTMHCVSIRCIFLILLWISKQM